MSHRLSIAELREPSGDQLQELFDGGAKLAESLLKQFQEEFRHRSPKPVQRQGQNAAKVDSINVTDDVELTDVVLTVDQRAKKFYLTWKISGDHNISLDNVQGLAGLGTVIANLNHALG